MLKNGLVCEVLVEGTEENGFENEFKDAVIVRVSDAPGTDDEGPNSKVYDVQFDLTFLREKRVPRHRIFVQCSQPVTQFQKQDDPNTWFFFAQHHGRWVVGDRDMKQACHAQQGNEAVGKAFWKGEGEQDIPEFRGEVRTHTTFSHLKRATLSLISFHFY